MKWDFKIKDIIPISPVDDYNAIRMKLGKNYEKIVNLMKGFFISTKRFLSFADPKNVEAMIFNYDSDMDIFKKVRCPILAVFGSREEFAVKPVRKYLDILQKYTMASKFDSY
ncbi:MAG: hypothetical protein QMD85_00595, partial [Candidatus Aenigmarchaeota archaeon]|nr:hypothetical protein [Candidatus Aenigmarchaeota archaeon]MDI6722025.1 hypothetical protein [Candidatus Aenigmarchaeota archaeon]